MGNMDTELQSVRTRTPIVYTKRIEDMAILRNFFCTNNIEEVVEIIIAESKPRYQITQERKNPIFDYPYKMCFNTLKLKRTDNNFTRIHKEVLHNIDKSERRQRTIITYKPNYLIANETIKVIKSDNETHKSELKSLLALCKPLRIVLVDICKTLQTQVNDEDNIDIVSIKSSDDEEIIFQSEIAITGTNNTQKTQKRDEDTNITSYYTITSPNDFSNFLNDKDLKNTIIVFYNMHIQQLDAYEIDEKYTVVDVVKAKYTRIYEFKTKTRDTVLNIMVCCWSKRMNYISLLLCMEKHNFIGRKINKRHYCKEVCTCCCSNIEKEKDNLNKIDEVINTENTSEACNKKKKMLIPTVLSYKKESKWQQNETKLNSKRNTSSNKLECYLLELRNNKNGTVELYETGNKELIYSKLIKSDKDHNNWLSKAQSVPRKRIISSFNDSKEREKQVSLLKNSMSISVSNYLKTPIRKDNINYPDKRNLDQNRNIQTILPYKIEHTRSFLRSRINKSRKVLSIVPQEFDSNVPVQVDNPEIGQHLAPATKDMEEGVSETVNTLIENILHRFRDVNLIINSDGKVSATLKAPITTLSPSELKILSDILTRAQSQVDELGLKPGNSLCPNPSNLGNVTPKNSPSNKQVLNTNPTKPNIPDIVDVDKTPQNRLLSDFSEWTNEKKICYEKSFRSFLNETKDVTEPKIVSVFSLNTEESKNLVATSSHATKSSPVKNNSNIITNNVNYPELTRRPFLNEVQTTSSLHNKIKSVASRGQKRKTVSVTDLQNEVAMNRIIGDMGAANNATGSTGRKNHRSRKAANVDHLVDRSIDSIQPSTSYNLHPKFVPGLKTYQAKHPKLDKRN